MTTPRGGDGYTLAMFSYLTLMRRFLLPLAVLLLGLPALTLAQRPTGGERPTTQPQQMLQGVIKGTVVDGATGEGVPSATVSVWSARDSSLVTGAITDDRGRFTIDRLRAGSFYVRVSFVGYESQTVSDVTLRPGAFEANVGTISLREDSALLGEVEVAGERSQVEVGIDRTIYNVEDQVIAKTGSATDLLQTVPSVEVDADGNISLRGNQNVAVLINGKPSPVRGEFLATFLRQLPGASIERIEVIPNPSAKYEPDGMSGIINIVLKESTDLGVSAGVILGGGTRGNGNASANATYGKGKWNLNANYGLRYDVRDPTGDTYRTFGIQSPLQVLNQNEFGDRKSLSHLFSTSADYQFNRQNSLSGSVLFSLRGGDETNTNASLEETEVGTFIRRYDRVTEGESDGFNMDYRVGFRRVIESSRHELNAEARYNYSENDNLDTYTQQLFSQAGAPLNGTPNIDRTQRDGNNQDASLQLDYMRPVGDAGRFEAGYKGSLDLVHSNFFADTLDYAQGQYIPQTSRNNTFNYDQLVNAGYLIYGHKVGKIATQVGVRAEQAQTTFELINTSESFDNSYLSFFPSAFVTYSPVETSTFKASYSRRVNRPRSRQLNPFTSNEDPLNIRVGNPRLKPEYTDAYELGFTKFTRTSSFTLTPFYRRTTDVVRRLKTVDPVTSVSTQTFENFATSASYGVELISTLRLGPVNMMLSLNGNRVVTDGSNVDTDLASDAFQWGGRANVSWTVRPGLDLQAFGFYRAPTKVEQGRISSFSMTDLSLRQRLLGDKASVSVRVSDVLDTSGFHFETQEEFYYQESSRRWGGRTAFLTFTYNFGQQPRNRNNQQRGNNEGGDFDAAGID